MIFKELLPEPMRIRSMQKEMHVPEPVRLKECKESLMEGMLNCWYEYVPSGYSGKEKVPLILEIHGGGTDGRRQAYETGWHILAERENVIVVYPNSLLFEHWHCEEREILYLEKLIRRICQKYEIDTTRIYMQGISNGDMMTQAFAQKKGDMLAAAGFITGPSSEEFLEECHTPLPVIQMRGEKDVLNGAPDFERDPYAVRDALNKLNVNYWAKINHAVSNLQITIRGKHNIVRYAGEPDVIFYEAKDVPHKETVEIPQIFWDYCYSRYARVEGKTVALPHTVCFQDEDAFAIAIGSEQVWRRGKTLPMAEEPNARTMYFAPQDDNFPVCLKTDCSHSRAMYAPITLLERALDVSVTVCEQGKRAEVKKKDRQTLVFQNGTEAVLTNAGLEGMNKPALYYCGVFYVPIAEVLETWFDLRVSILDDVLYASSHYARLAHNTARILREELHGVLLGDPEK